jgi:hypothetical protein
MIAPAAVLDLGAYRSFVVAFFHQHGLLPPIDVDRFGAEAPLALVAFQAAQAGKPPEHRVSMARWLDAFHRGQSAD